MTFQFKIQIRGIKKPPVWRRIVVPDNITFLKFHYITIAAFGWSGGHLFSFSERGLGSDLEIGYIDKINPEAGISDASKILIKKIFKNAGQKFIYTYDFGDDWNHIITLEKVTTDKITKTECIGGKGQCPPEDCGGVWGFEELLEVIKDADNPQYEEMREWLGLEEGEIWDPNDFDLESTNDMVENIKVV